ncbi:DUF2087 domain-containing protein [Paenibacillus sinopodophylli]|uniref:DUF2087 domain-containing protein n=1 Tax=Paenibacillus sinopodophylli TaxID=1837342 RepID=UPI00110CFD5F|nr:DUF2087 domain-containing protein [Paenibacillus sinopodophylli]
MWSEDRFWTSSVEELKQGYVFDELDSCYHCLICGEGFEDGEIFREDSSGRWFEARKYASHHVGQAHGSMLNYLLELDKRQTGLTDLQKELIRGFADQLSDQELMGLTGAGSASTIRNHRFVLKEKAKQAKLLLAIMEMMEQGATASPRFMPVHRTATQVDERYAMTEDEDAAVLKQYLPKGLNGPLASFPRKEKRKIAVLRHIAAFFKGENRYSEKEVNELLSQFWESDYVTLRRYLIEYGFLDRSDDGRAYWVKGTEKGLAEAAHPKKEVSSEQGTALEQSEKGKKGKSGKQKQQDARRGDEARMDKAKRKQLTAEYQERERMMGVFQIKNNVNGKLYIGGSTNLDAFWGKEQFVLNMDTHANKELQKEWKQFGSESFSYLVLETVKLDQKIHYDYKDVLDPEGRQPVDLVRQYNREVGELKEQWLEKLQPFGEKGYHIEKENGNKE